MTRLEVMKRVVKKKKRAFSAEVKRLIAFCIERSFGML